MTIRNKSPPIFSIAGKVTKKVIIVPFKVLFPLNKNRIRAILKLLIIVTWGPNYKLEILLTIIPIHERIIITKSKIFH